MKQTALRLINILKDNGFRVFFAGGCVRDMLLNIEPKDYDIATNAKPEQIEKIFPKTVPVGKQFGVICVIEKKYKFEIATFRSDSGSSDGRRPNAILFTDPKEDAKRRDFTINGLFYDPIEDFILDYVEGKRDLQERLIRFIGSPSRRIQEDHLRLIRAVRFAHQIKGQYHPETYKALRHHANLIQDVSIERIRDEFNKILLLPNRDQALEDLFDLGILHYILPELVETKGIAQPHMYHQEGSVWKHILRSLHSIRQQPSLELIWAILLHDIGKPRTFKIDTRIRFNKHETASALLTKEILHRFKFPKKFIETVTWAVSHHMMLMNIFSMTKQKQVHWILHPHFHLVLALWKADIQGSIPTDLSAYKQLRLLATSIKKQIPKKLPPLLSGTDIMKKFHLPSGPVIGKLLHKIEEQQILEKIKTKKNALQYIEKTFTKLVKKK